MKINEDLRYDFKLLKEVDGNPNINSPYANLVVQQKGKYEIYLQSSPNRIFLYDLIKNKSFEFDASSLNVVLQQHYDYIIFIYEKYA